MERRRPVALIAAGALILLLLVEGALSLLVLDGYRRQLEPELRLKAQVAGQSVARRVGQALGYGIPLEGLVGLDEVVEPLMRQAPELARVALTDPGGRTVYARGAVLAHGEADSVSLPVLGADGREAARLELSVSRAFLRRQLGLALTEVATVAAVGAIATVELLIFLLGRGVAARDGADAALGRRLALFLLVAGAGLALPLALTLAGSGTGLAVTLALAGLGAAWARPGFRPGAGLAMLGLAVTSQASGLMAVAGLGLAGLGQGLALGAALARVPGPRPTAFLLGATLAAAACGPALGGMLADLAGPGAALAAGAVLAGAAALAWPPERGERRPAPTGTLWRNWRLLALGLFGAAPARLLLAGFVLVELPGHLAAAGAGWAEIGRAQMLWALPAMALTPALAALADRLRRGEGLLVGLGGILSGAAFVPVLFVGLGDWLLVAALLLGVGQAMVGAGLPRLALRVARGEAAAADVPRYFGWAGAAAGPLLFGSFAAAGEATAAALAGAGVVAAAVVLCTLLLCAGYEPERQAEGVQA